MKIKYYLFLILFLIVLIISFFPWEYFSNSDLNTIKIGDAKISIEIADTTEKREKGLSGRKLLPENQGMLFLFEQPGYYSFWMKDTLMPLDFIWIKNNKVVEVTENVRPEDFQPPKFLTPKEEINATLEVNAGFIDRFNIKVGDEIIFD